MMVIFRTIVLFTMTTKSLSKAKETLSKLKTVE